MQTKWKTMLTILLNPKSPEQLYQQLCQAIRAKIADGTLKPREKLPSRRVLSMYLQVSMITVQTAYEQLTTERYLYAVPSVGYYVDPDALLLVHTPAPTDSIPAPKPPASSVRSDSIAFSTSGVDLKQFPFSTWAKLSRQVLTAQQEALLHGTPPLGLSALREVIAAHLLAFRGMQVSPEQILVGAGTEYLLGILVQLLGASRRYAAEDPGYRKGKQILRCNGASVIAVAMDQDGLDQEKLQRSGASVAHVTPSHQFPTGTTMPLRRRAVLLDWVNAQPDRYLIEDDYDSELCFQGKLLPTLYSLDQGQHVIYMNTFARTLAPSLRIGYVVLPPKLAVQFAQKLSFYACSVPAFEQYTLTRFLQDGCFERHLNRMKKTYRLRQAILIKQLRSHPLSDRLQICGEAAGLQLLLKVQLPCTEQDLIDAADRANVIVTGLPSYYDVPKHLPDQMSCIILGYARLSPEQITT